MDILSCVLQVNDLLLFNPQKPTKFVPNSMTIGAMLLDKGKSLFPSTFSVLQPLCKVPPEW